MNRRPVRVTDEFYNDLDSYLGAGRGPNGEPSAIDFLRLELLPLIDIIAEQFDDLPKALPGHPEYRVLITNGRLIPYISIMGMLQSDGSVELIQLELGLDD